MVSPWFRTHQSLVALAVVCILGAGGAFLKLQYLGITPGGDYGTYVATAQFFSHDPNAEVIPYRILKPLNPLLVAALHTFMSYQDAFLLQALFFYFALAFAMFALAYEFLEDRFLASCAALLVILSYPILRYGVDTLTETGAVFFYVLSLWLTVLFLKVPRVKEFLVNVGVLLLGFLWKEYSAVSAAVLGFAILLHKDLGTRGKILYLLSYVALFLAVNIPFQIYIFLTYHYTYFSWWFEGGAPLSTACELDLHDITKSTAALLGLAWFAVPFGLWRFRSLPAHMRTFFTFALPVPFMAFVWGCVSSRLLYVIAPPFVLIALWGMKDWKRSYQVIFIAVTLAANIVWLFLSYSIKL